MAIPFEVSPAYTLTIAEDSSRYLGQDVPGAALYGTASNGLLPLAVGQSDPALANLGLVEFRGSVPQLVFMPDPAAQLVDADSGTRLDAQSLAAWPGTPARVAGCFAGGVALWERQGADWAMVGWSDAQALGNASAGMLLLGFASDTGELFALSVPLAGGRATYRLAPGAGAPVPALVAELEVEQPGSFSPAGAEAGAALAGRRFLVHDMGSSQIEVGAPSSGSTNWSTFAQLPIAPPVAIGPVMSGNVLAYWAPAGQDQRMHLAEPATLQTLMSVPWSQGGNPRDWAGVDSADMRVLARRSTQASEFQIYPEGSSDYLTLPFTANAQVFGGGALCVLDGPGPLVQLSVYPWLQAPAAEPTHSEGAVVVTAALGLSTADSGEKGIRHATGAVRALARVRGAKGGSDTVSRGSVVARAAVLARVGPPVVRASVAVLAEVLGTALAGRLLSGAAGVGVAAGTRSRAAPGTLARGQAAAVAGVSGRTQRFSLLQGRVAAAAGVRGRAAPGALAHGQAAVQVLVLGRLSEARSVHGAVAVLATVAPAVPRSGQMARGAAAAIAIAWGQVAKVRIRHGYLMGPFAAMARHELASAGYAQHGDQVVAYGADQAVLAGPDYLPATLVTRSSDLGNPRTKTVRHVWVDAHMEAGAVLHATTEEGTAFYPVEVYPDTHTQRVDLGRGASGRYWQIALHTHGGALRLRAIEAQTGAMQRRRTK